MFLIFFYLIIVFSFSTSSALDFPSEKDIVDVEIIPTNGAFVIEDEYYFGIKFRLADGWKTYWKNPGDSGAPLSVEFKNNNNEKLEILYPFPEKFVEKGIRTIGYEDTIIFPIKFNPKKLNLREQKIKIDYLVCKEVCIPVTSYKHLDLSSKNLLSSDEFLDNFKKVPKRKNDFFIINQLDMDSNDNLVLKIKSKNDEELKVFGYSEETNLTIDEGYKGSKSLFKISLDEKIGDLQKPLYISISDGKKFEEILFWPNKKSDNENIFYYILIAILGGLILNFMPCVLPVLSIKLYNFSSVNKLDSTKIRSSCFYIILGIFFSFLCLALSVVMFKIFGQTVGWGFQFQNIYFLSFITIIIFLFSLNLLGFFEIILSSSLLNRVNKFLRYEGKINHFLSGAFATLLATPCSAPFLGTAVGFSMLASNLNILLIFMSISLGFSIPYFLFIVFPKIINLFPKPGSWMINFRYFLGFLLYLSAIWMMTLLNINEKLIFLVSILILYLSYLREKNSFKKVIFVLFLISSFSFLTNKLYISKEKIVWFDFNKELLEKNLKNEKVIIVDVTADWCVTCQVNKLTTLSTRKFYDYVKKNDVVTLRADWTKKDTDILEFIKEFGRFGIPVNIIYGPNNKEGILLPEIITNDMVIDKFIKVGKK